MWSNQPDVREYRLFGRAFVALGRVRHVFYILDLPRRKLSRELLAVWGLVYFAVVLSVLVFQTYSPAPLPTPKNEPLIYGPTDWTPKGNLRAGIGSIAGLFAFSRSCGPALMASRFSFSMFLL